MPRINQRLTLLALAILALFAAPARADDSAAHDAPSITAATPAADSTTPPAVAAPAANAAAPQSADVAAKPDAATPAVGRAAAAPAAPAANGMTTPTVTGSSLPSQPAGHVDLNTPLNPAEQQDLWARLRKGFKLGNIDTPQVHQAERFYARKPEYMQRVTERSRRYLYFIVGEVEKRGMPTEIALLPIVESAFVPQAESRVRASGLWQFMPATGQRYGLERTWWYDGRQDVMAATYAALDYLQDLYNQFGDWQLALAAYNWGEGGVGRAVAKARARGIEGNFDNIHKPQETTSYVPQLIAVRNLINDPQAFGLTLPDMPNKPYFEPVSTGRHIDVQLAAKLADTTVEEILHLNPGLIRPVFAYKDDRKLLLPADKVDTFEQNLQHYDKPLLSWQPYVTRRGESLASIAAKFNMSETELRDVNKLGGHSAKGETILVPIRDNVEVGDRQNLAALIASAGSSDEDSKPSAGGSSRPDNHASTHRVARGETLAAIAKRYGMTTEHLRAINGLKSSKVAVGRTLTIDGGGNTEVATSHESKHKAHEEKATRYVVRRGDTLDDIARAHDVSVGDLKRWNHAIARGALKVGYKLSIHG